VDGEYASLLYTRQLLAVMAYRRRRECSSENLQVPAL
jgi:hypothetical protein